MKVKKLLKKYSFGVYSLVCIFKFTISSCTQVWRRTMNIFCFSLLLFVSVSALSPSLCWTNIFSIYMKWNFILSAFIFSSMRIKWKYQYETSNREEEEERFYWWKHVHNISLTFALKPISFIIFFLLFISMLIFCLIMYTKYESHHPI